MTSIDLYWTDVVENKTDSNDSVWVFGRERETNMSYAILVKNIPITVYACPKEKSAKLTEDEDESEDDDTSGDEARHQKLTECAEEMIAEIKVFAATRGLVIGTPPRVVKRNYAFEHDDVPRGFTEFVKFSLFNRGSSYANVSGRTFSHLIGSAIPPLREFIVGRYLKGPGWVRVVGAELVPSNKALSWCKREYTVNSPKQIVSMIDGSDAHNLLPDPPLRVLQIDVRQTPARGGSFSMVSFRASSEKKTTAGPNSGKIVVCVVTDDAATADAVASSSLPPMLTKTQAVLISNVERLVFHTETEMLSRVLREIDSVDPDIVVGDRMSEFLFPRFAERARALNITAWSRLSKLKNSVYPRGLVICDVGDVAGDLITRPLRSHSIADIYSMLFLGNSDQSPMGNNSMTEVESVRRGDSVLERATATHLPDIYINGIIPSMCALILTSSIINKLDALALTKHMSNITGHIWSHILCQKRAEQIDYLLAHEYHTLKFVLPDIPTSTRYVKGMSSRTTKKRKQKIGGKRSCARDDDSEDDDTYTGGLVIKPTPGLYNDVGVIVLLDFVSTYPSLIIGHNVCHTTFDKYTGKIDKSSEGVLPRILTRIVNERKAVKAKLKESTTEEERAELQTLQQALKLVSNKAYGCLAYKNSQFFNMLLAAKVAELGRITLTLAKTIVEEKLKFRVLYGDSDSLMIATNEPDRDKALVIAQDIADKVNAACGIPGLGMAVDRLFRTVLIVTKKKYAAMDAFTGKCEFKGMDLVRRDWCEIACDTSREVASLFLKEGKVESTLSVVEKVIKSAAERVVDQTALVSEFVITQCLRKDLGEYGKSDLRHVRAAKGAKKRAYRAKDFVPYVMCIDENTTTHAKSQSAIPVVPWEHGDTQMTVGQFPLKLDVRWYFNKQLFPTLERICHSIIPNNESNKFVSCALGITKPTHKRSSEHITIEGGGGGGVFHHTAQRCDIEKDIMATLAYDFGSVMCNPLYAMLVDEQSEYIPDDFFVLCSAYHKTIFTRALTSTETGHNICEACKEEFSDDVICEQFRVFAQTVTKKLTSKRQLASALVYLRTMVDSEFVETVSGVIDLKKKLPEWKRELLHKMNSILSEIKI